MKKRLLSTLCALCLCLTLLPTAALADGLETGTPTLLNGEGETDYATPSEEDGWTQLSDGTWFLVAEKTYEQPFYSDLPIHVEAGGSLTAPSITVEGRVQVTGSASLNCSGELRAEELHVSVGATVGTLSCETVFVSGYAILTVTSRWNCSGTVEVEGALYLPAETVPNWNNFSGNGTVYIGDMAYDTAGNEQGTAMLILTSDASASGEGYTWDGETCTLTLDGFTRTYGENADGSIGIMAEGEDVTLELKGENVMTGLSGNAMGIYCEGGSLTLKGAGSLDCGEAMAALVIYDGSLALAEGYSLNEEAEIYNISDGESSAGHVIQAGTAESNPIPATSFTIFGKQTLTITGVTATSRDYNGSNTVAITGVTLGGVIDNDDVSVDTSGLTGTLSSANVGTYNTLTLSGTVNLTGADKGNYTLTLPTEGMTVTTVNDGSGVTISQAESTISIKDTYTLNYTYTGQPLANPTSDQLTLTGAGYNGVTFTWYKGTSPNGTELDSAPTDTGTYYLVASISDSNNTSGSSTTSGAITISPATISISSATVEGKTYDGNIDATVESVTFNDLNGSDILTIGTDYTATAVFENANAGESKSATVTVTLNNGNYTFGSNSNTANTTATAAIQQAALTVTAPSETITVGDPIPDLNSLKVTVTGLVGNDTFSGVTLTYDGNPDNSQPGTWAIEPSGGEFAYGVNKDNYTVSYVNGTLTVEKKPVSGGGTSGGTTTPSGPSTGGSDGWTEIEDEVDETPSGSTVTVDMNGTTEVPAEVFEAVAGKDVTLELDMGGGVKWEINGKDIPADTDFTDLDLGVKLNTSTIPVDVINLVTGEKSTVQLSLAHDGEFGFTMTLTAPVGTENKGLWANLYHYNTTKKQMLLETSAQVDSSGNVALKFTHASEYAIVLDESSHELPFTDTAKGAWYQGAVEYVYRNGIMTGTSATTFEPNASLSRAMVAQILYNLEGQPAVEGESTFTDASTHWAVDAITWAQETGVVNGYEDNTFRPNRAVTREELAQMLYNYAKVKGYDLTASGDLTAFPDGSKVSSWAEAAMAWANGNELINGHDDGTLQPGGDSTRAQAASILMSFDLNLAN